MGLIATLLAVLFGCLALVLAAVVIPWAVIAWRELGPAPRHASAGRPRPRPAPARGGPAVSWPPPEPAADTMELPEPVQAALEQMWAAAPWITERPA